MIDQLKSMAIFAIVVETGSFRSAAKRLELSPSVVSSHISNLEKQIGAALLYRSTRALTLTREGERLHRIASAMVNTARDGLDLFSTDAPERLTNLRVAIPAMLSFHPVFERIVEFAKSRAGIRLSIVSSDRPHDLLKDGIDVAVRMGTFRNSDFKTRRIGEERRTVVAAPSYVAQKPKPKTPDDLLDWNFISFAPVPDIVRLSRGKQKPLTVWGKTAAITDSVETMRALAIAGMGVTAIPFQRIKDDLARNRLTEVLPDWSEQILPINLTWPRNAGLNASTREFIDILSA